MKGKRPTEKRRENKTIEKKRRENNGEKKVKIGEKTETT